MIILSGKKIVKKDCLKWIGRYWYVLCSVPLLTGRGEEDWELPSGSIVLDDWSKEHKVKQGISKTIKNDKKYV